METANHRFLVNRTEKFAIAFILVSSLAPNLAAQGISRINGDLSRELFGRGTGVIVGIIDSGVDDTHPALAGPDSLGAARLASEANFVPTEPGNTGDDLYGHGTAVGGIILGNGDTFQGLAPDARYVNSRVLDANNSFQTTSWVMNGVGFAIENGADVLNLSLNTYGEFSDGMLAQDRMLDWAAFEQGILSVVCAGNISQASGGNPTVRSPAGSFNSIAVGWTSATHNYNQLHSNSSIGPTSDGRMKPDVVAPGHLITTLNSDWETQDDFVTRSGGSFATPHATGLVTQQIEYGRNNGLSTNPLVLKSTLLNSAEKSIFDKNGDSWAPFAASQQGGVYTITSPLDDELGAGQIDGLALYQQYDAGEQKAGQVKEIGWDLHTISDSESIEYFFDAELLGHTDFTATLTWSRQVDYVDNGNGVIDQFDQYNVTEPLANLDLTLLQDGVPIAASVSTVDNVEHLFFNLTATADYSLRIDRQNISGTGPDTQFGIAWWATAIPEPSGTLILFAIGLTAISRRQKKCR